MNEKNGDLIVLSNREIVSKILEDNLPRTCLDYQYAKLVKENSWKYQYKEDAYQDLILFLLEYDNEKLNDAYRNNHMNALITRILINQLWSDSSKFYVNYIKFRRYSNDYENEEFKQMLLDRGKETARYKD